MWNDEVRAMLDRQIIPFWSSLADPEFGGFCGLVDFDLKRDWRAPKGTILTARICWFFSQAYMLERDPELLRLAEHAYVFLRRHCLDPEHGGAYWSVTYDGTPADDAKHTYVQAFVIYALAAYFQASGDQAALAEARELFRLVEARCALPYPLGTARYAEAFSRDFTPQPNEQLSGNGVVAEHTMNTLLHVFEAYSELYQAEPLPEVGLAMRRILATFLQQVYQPGRHRLEVFFDERMSPIIDLHSYGHDIEASWLLDWGVALLDDSALAEEVAAMNSDLAETVYQLAYHDHSLWKEAEAGVPNQIREWWVQAEAVLGFHHHFLKHPDRPEFAAAAQDVWTYVRDKLADPRPGSEWFRELDPKGRPVPGLPIVEEWKCPYHSGRMCIELLKGLNRVAS